MNKNTVKLKKIEYPEADTRSASGPGPLEIHSPVEFSKPENQAGGTTAAVCLRMRPPAAGLGNQNDGGGGGGG